MSEMGGLRILRCPFAKPQNACGEERSPASAGYQASPKVSIKLTDHYCAKRMPILKRLLERMFTWADRQLGMPTNDDLRHQYTNWDYSQANSEALWAAEENQEALQAAMLMRENDPTSALVALRELADAGSAIAMNEVGEIYHWGRGVGVNEGEAEVWLKKACLAGSQRALLTYGRLLLRQGCLFEAEAVFKAGADAGWPPAIYWLASTQLRLQQKSRARSDTKRLLEMAVAMGHPAARWKLGRAMAWGRFGLRDIPRGMSMIFSYALERASEASAKP
jgi:hypothetical protein